MEDTGQPRKLSPKTPILSRNSTLGEERIDDLTGLAFLHEASVLNTIRSRYGDGSIYTFSGIVLTAVNPYCRQPIYEREVIWAYNERQREELAPHLFSIAEDALRSLFTHGKSQSIIVSGESGAGKTISAKYIMRYFAEVCAVGSPSLRSMDNVKETGSKKATVEDRVLATNPILEAFGNAKTMRNDNSSRFGKYVQIFFNAGNAISGAAIKTYLLEKTRVVGQAEGERNFHIFYQLLAGCPEAERIEFCLGRWVDFCYLSASKCGNINDVDDAEEFSITKNAMAVAGFSEEHQWQIFKILAAILHLGNIEFNEDADFHSSIKEESPSSSSLEMASSLLGVDKEGLAGHLIRRKIIAAHETVDAFNNRVQALASRDSLAKYLYSAIFNHIVEGLDSNLLPAEECEKFIGVLDIYGFEKFDVNSFEQFCINYANEKLQNLFNKHVFDLEQRLYTEEGIDWSLVEFHDNQACIDLIESKLGILDLLDEECRFPNGSDLSFVAKLYDKQLKTDASGCLLRPKVSEEGKFTVRHFAYDVDYVSNGFIDKNHDQVPGDLLGIVGESGNSFIRKLLAPGMAALAASRETLALKSKDATRIKLSTGMAFKISLGSLMDVISSTRSHYIRCIKPNEQKEAMMFDAPFVIQQLRACGILETVRISSAGYPGRWHFVEFLERFKLLASDPCSIVAISDAREGCLQLLKDFEMSPEQFQVGKTRVFMRAGVLAALEEARTTKLTIAAIRIQSIVRVKSAIVQLEDAVKMATKIQTEARRLFAWMKYRKLAEEKAFYTIDSIYKSFTQQCLLLQAKKATSDISATFKMFQTRLLSKELQKVTSITTIATYLRLYSATKRYQAQLLIALAIQSRYRKNIAWTQLLKYKEEARSVEHLKETSDMLQQKIADLTQQLLLADEHLAYERKVNAALQQKTNNVVVADDKELDNLQEELGDAKLKIESYERMVESLEAANNELFERNEELAKQVRIYRLERINSDRLSKNTQNQSLANIILRDTDTPPQSFRHLRVMSYDSSIDVLGEMDLPEIPQPVATTDQEEIKQALDDPGCLAELLHIIETARIPKTPDERAVKSMARVPCRILERWVISWLQVGSNPEIVKAYLDRALGHIKLSCMSIHDAFSHRDKRHHTAPMGSIISADRKLAFWIANLFDFLCFLQWAVSDLNESDLDHEADKSEERQLSQQMLVLLQLRTDVARVVEELYRAWMTDLFRSYSRLGIAALLDHQGLTGFTSENGTKPDTKTSLKMFMMPFAKLAGDNDVKGAVGIDDLLDALDELSDAMEASHLQSEIVIQLLSSVITNFCSAAFNQILLRKNYASWKRGIQIQYNLSRLEEWANMAQAKNPGYFFSPSPSNLPSPTKPSSNVAATTTSPLQQIEPLIQAVKLLQLAKTRVASDLSVLIEACPRLNVAQIRKILAVYVPDAYEDGPVSPEVLRGLTMRIQQHQYERKEHLLETLPEVQPQSLPLQLSIKPIEPVPFGALPTSAVPPHLWKIFALIDK